MDNLNVYDVNDVNGMMKGMGKMDTCVLLRWGRERVCIYFYNYL